VAKLAAALMTMALVVLAALVSAS